MSRNAFRNIYAHGNRVTRLPKAVPVQRSTTDQTPSNVTGPDLSYEASGVNHEGTGAGYDGPMRGDPTAKNRNDYQLGGATDRTVFGS